MYTDLIFDTSERVFRASEIGVTDSSNISCAFSPEPAVRDSNPIQIQHSLDL